MNVRVLSRYTRLTAICLVAATLAACSTVPTQPPASQAARADGTFERSGRFALTVYDRSAERNRDSVQGGFTWLDTGAVLTLDLTNPLGSTLARVVVADNQAVLTRSNGQRTVASDPDAWWPRCWAARFRSVACATGSKACAMARRVVSLQASIRQGRPTRPGVRRRLTKPAGGSICPILTVKDPRA
nr:lipoprotein insertase outer membrane protein LolB [Advenella kashmirensis]